MSNMILKRKAKPSPSGEGYIPIFKKSIVDGNPKYEMTGKRDIHEMIEAAYEDTRIYTILDRLTPDGVQKLADSSKRLPFMDVSQLPKNLHELYSRGRAAKQAYDSLPKQVKDGLGTMAEAAQKPVSEVNSVLKSYVDNVVRSALAAHAQKQPQPQPQPQPQKGDNK